jgi:hypothetical protein
MALFQYIGCDECSHEFEVYFDPESGIYVDGHEASVDESGFVSSQLHYAQNGRECESKLVVLK